MTSSSSSARMTALMTFVQGQLIDPVTRFTLGPGIDIHFQLFSDPSPVDGYPGGIGLFTAMGTEGCSISVAPWQGGIKIFVAAATDHGLWNGGMTVIQLLLTDATPSRRETAIVPRLIRDYPDNPVRGGHVYTARPTVDPTTGKFALGAAAKARIDQLARMKLNVLYDV